MSGFKVGDFFISHCDVKVYKVVYMHGTNITGRINNHFTWTYVGRFGLRHATPKEIEQGYRDE